MTAEDFGCGRIGIATWQLDLQPAGAARDAVLELENLGYGAIWLPELMWREAFSNAAILLAASKRIVVASGVASVYSRTAHTTQLGWKTLTEAFPDRYVLGIGVGHAAHVERFQKADWSKPYRTMVDYLDQLDAGRYTGAPPTATPRRVLAALGPRMLGLARDRSAGAFTNCTPVEHTARAREILGPDAFLAVSLVTAVSEDPARGRELGRRYVGDLSLPSYRDNLARLGWSEEHLAGPSDELVDALVAWGSPAAIAERVHAHLEAGASHVCLNVQPPGPSDLPMAEWSRLAEAMKDLTKP
jgi:probable F420-dependent oxidoreductase